MNAVVSVLPSSVQGWVRFCTIEPDVRLTEYAEGFGRLKGPHAADWLQLSFPELLQSIRNSRTN